MDSKDKRAIKFWSGVTFIMLMLALWGLFGCSAGQEQPKAAEPSTPAMSVDEEAFTGAMGELQDKVRQSVFDLKVKLGIMDPDGTEVTKLEKWVRGNMADLRAKLDQVKADYEAQLEAEAAAAEAAQQAYYEPAGYSGGYSGGSAVTDLHALLNSQGRAIGSDGVNYTYYNYDIGYGPIDYRIPGCYFDEDGVAHDGEGYIAVARSDYDPDGPVVTIDTEYGPARIYDKCRDDGVVDVYTNK